jgi:uncharacterized lipoprotein YajG
MMKQWKDGARRWLRVMLALTVSMFASGCALTQDRIEIAYASTAPPVLVKGAERVGVEVRVVDSRQVSSTDDLGKGESKVSAKKNGFGMEMAAIVATNDIPAILRGAITSELAGRGFTIRAGSIVVLVELSKYWNDFKVGAFSGSAAAEMTMNVQVKGPDGSIVFTKLVTGQGMAREIALASGDNAKVALEAALRNAVGQVVAEGDFISALLKANAVEAPAAPAS